MHDFQDQQIGHDLSFHESLLMTCVEAARRNAKLIIGLMESRAASMMLTLRYHFTFNAALILELALLHEYGVKSDIKLIEYLIQDLWNQGRNVDECSLDCAKIVAEFYAVVQHVRKCASKPDLSQKNGAVGASQESNNDDDDSISYRRVLSAVELSASYLPEIEEPQADRNATSRFSSES